MLIDSEIWRILLSLDSRPDAAVTASVVSSDVLPEIGEYGRVSTTVANAYVQPIIDRYLSALVGELREMGSTGGFFVMGSNAGSLSLDVARNHPVRLVESGPAAGVSIAAPMSSAARSAFAWASAAVVARPCLAQGRPPARSTSFMRDLSRKFFAVRAAMPVMRSSSRASCQEIRRSGVSMSSATP